MENRKLVLLVDDNEILRHGMRLILESGNFQVEEACNGREAKELMGTARFDIIVSAAEMPEMDGLALLRFCKESSSSKFLLFSEFSPALQSRQALALGADQFLVKPFGKDQLLHAVAQALSDTAIGGEENSIEKDFVPVPVDDFVTGSVLRVDLYVQLSPNKFLKIGHKNGAFAQGRAEAYKAKNVRWFYMAKADYAQYVGFNINLAQVVHNTDRIECARKLKLTMHVTETVLEQLRNSGLNREQLEDASHVVMNAVDLISSNPSTLKLLESMEVCGTLPSHSIAVAIWSCLIARAVDYEGSSTYFRLAISALFHDIGEKELPDEFHTKPRFEMNKQQRKLLESHTIRGRDILQSVPGMPEDAAIVALQHHELVNGGGYPYALKLHQIHPFARLIGLADALCELIKNVPAGKPVKYSEFFATLSQNERDYDPQFLRALGEMLPGVAKNRDKAV